jgi:hypothetical protein
MAHARLSSVYYLTHLASGREYIGITSRKPSVRWAQHRLAVREGASTRIARALRKYGCDAFSWQVIATLPTFQEAQIAERILVAVRRPVFNMTAGGDGTCSPVRETLEKIAAANKRSWADPSSRARRLRIAKENAQKVDQEAKGRKISALFSTPEQTQKLSRRALAQIERNGGQQLEAARQARWSQPGAREYMSVVGRQRVQTAETRRKVSIAATIQHATRRGELQLWL